MASPIEPMLVAAPVSGLMEYRLEAGRESSAATPVAPYSTGAAEAAGTASAPAASSAPAAAIMARTGLGTVISLLLKANDGTMWGGSGTPRSSARGGEPCAYGSARRPRRY